jgi:acyl carrier protein
VWFPLIGWMAGYWLQVQRIDSANDQVVEQLATRTAFPAEAWIGVGIDPAFAEHIASIVCEAQGFLPNHHYLPADPVELLTLESDGLGFMDCTFRIERCLNICVPSDQLFECDTFRELVEVVSKHVK